MVTLAAVPMRWFSWDFSLQQPTGEMAGQVCLSSWRERGSIHVPGFSCKVRRDGLRGPFLAEASDGSRVASAIKPSALRREFAITHADRRYVLKAVSSWRRECALFDEGATQLGQVRPESWLSRRAHVELDDQVPPLLQAFVVWLTLLLWKRDGDAVAAGTAGS